MELPPNEQNQAVNEALRVRMPATISVRDVFFIISVVVSGIVAFGSLSSRTSVIETKVNDIKIAMEKQEASHNREEEMFDNKLDVQRVLIDKRFDELEKEDERLKLQIHFIKASDELINRKIRKIK